jgi:hypothetical protein
MSKIFVSSGVVATLLMVIAVSPANAFRGGGGGGFHGGGFHGGGFHEGFHSGGFHGGFHDHDRFHERGFRGPGFVGGLALGLGLGAVGGALLYPPPVYFEPPPVYYESPPVCLAPPPLGGYCGPDGLPYPY